MDISPTAIFNVVVGIIIAVIFYLLFRRMKATYPDGETNVFAYGQLLLQAEQTARIIVRGVQEAWRTGELEDDEREDDAIDKLVELYPELDEDDLRRIVKSAVYLLRLGAGKQVDRVMEYVPDELPSIPVLAEGTISGLEMPKATWEKLSGLKTSDANWDASMSAQSSGGVAHTNLPG